MEAYVVLDWLTIIAGLVVYRREQGIPQALFGLRSPKRAAPNQWCLPTGVGALRRDASSFWS